jgi:hypothetical protein
MTNYRVSTNTDNRARTTQDKTKQKRGRTKRNESDKTFKTKKTIIIK